VGSDVIAHQYSRIVFDFLFIFPGGLVIEALDFAAIV